MNSKLPFEDAFEKQMNNLPLPNENDSWQKMEELLDENKNEKRFAFSKTYHLIILIILLVGALWLFLLAMKTIKEKPLFAITAPSEKMNGKQKTVEENQPKSIQKTKTIKQKVEENYKSNEPTDTREKARQTPLSVWNLKKSERQRTRNLADRKAKSAETGNLLISVRYKGLPTVNATSATKLNTSDTKINIQLNQNNTSPVSMAAVTTGKSGVADSSGNIAIVERTEPTTPEKDSVINKEATDTIPSTPNKVLSLKKNGRYFISGGLGIQQQLPVSGQKLSSYAPDGTKSAFFDYIPSVFVRLEKDQQWFLQGEFVYGSPRLVKKFPYSRQTQAHYASATVTTTTLQLQKTFYNAVPISFNYYLYHNWSVGIGGEFNWLNGAIAEKEISTNNAQAQAQSVVKQIVPIRGFTDSFLYKTNINLLLQMDYNWRRLALSLRFAKDVQPYIKYTLPDGTVNDEKNWSLELILRWQLFKSAKFSVRK